MLQLLKFSSLNHLPELTRRRSVMPEPFNDPLVLSCVLAMPIVIIGIAVYWKKIKVKKAEQNAGKES